MEFDSLEQNPPPSLSTCRRRNTWPTGDDANLTADGTVVRSVSDMKLTDDGPSGESSGSGDDVVLEEQVQNDDVVVLENNNQVQNDDVVVNQGGDQNGIVVAGAAGAAAKSYGEISMIGRRRDLMDATAVDLGFMERGGKRYDLFGVYDGRGRWRVASACVGMVHRLVANEADVAAAEWGEDVIDWGAVVSTSVKKMDALVRGRGGNVAAVVAMVGESEVVVASSGQTKAVLLRGGVVENCHVPTDGDDGGDGDGDSDEADDDEIEEPRVSVIKRTLEDEFLIIGSDGLWNVVNNESVALVGHKPYYCHEAKVAGEAACLLAELAMARGSKDNISVIVVQL